MPLGTTDFSSYMLAAKNAHPQVLALLNAGADTVNSMKAAKEFGLDKQMKIVVGLFFLPQVDADPSLWAGAKVADSWYWDQNAQTRAVGRPLFGAHERRASGFGSSRRLFGGNAVAQSGQGGRVDRRR